MKSPSLEFWNKKHFEEDELKRMSQHSVFAEESLKYFPSAGRVLELGVGIGSDALFLASQGFQVMATDFSKDALAHIPESLSLKTQQQDLNQLFPFADQEFDVVYAHLALHYFDRETTQQIFDEISRVLKPEGIIAVLLNSKTDSEYGQGKLLEKDYFDLPNKGPKRFFSVATLKPFVIKFETILLDDKGSDPRRNHKEDLIRFIGKKNCL
ncbi:MAG: class I SAM-dependent methyltransferase [Candidatus Daviesbacteria bacterium]|nr:class I SAM-dependent methyltransferase [Candidatus Daviesbacteria bacterium]